MQYYLFQGKVGNTAQAITECWFHNDNADFKSGSDLNTVLQIQAMGDQVTDLFALIAELQIYSVTSMTVSKIMHILYSRPII